MRWMDGISEAINYIERNIKEPVTIDDITRHAGLSTYYFQKGFSMLCGWTVGEYIRLRRLSLAGSELASTDRKIIDIALDYGYDSPDSFTKAFTRFHGVTPTAVRRDGATLKSFAPLKITIALQGGNIMDYKIVQKEAFTIMGAGKMFNYERSSDEIPAFWAEHYRAGKGEVVCGLYGVCFEASRSANGDEFEYLIADNYDPHFDVPAGCVTKIIPAHTWAVFPCKGPMPKALQDVNQKIFSEWLPNNRDYEITGNYNVEAYGNPEDFPDKTQDANYYSEIWIPVKKI